MGDIYSMTLMELRGEKVATESALRRIIALIEQMEQAAVENQLERLVHGFESSSWICEKSPAGRCAYDTDKDPSCDSCLFCGKPKERK